MKRKELFQGLVFSLILLLAMANNGTADTPVSGIIDSDTTWTLADSPYIVIGDVQIPNGVTLTIEAGVVIKYAGAYEILVKGSIIANGTVDNIIPFTSLEPNISSGATMLKFEGTDLSSSQLSYIKMEYASKSIRVGAHPGTPNTGTLTASHIDITSAEVRTGGYETQAKLVLSDATITSTTVIGVYPRSEPIEIKEATISNSTIISDSYNKGILVENAVVTNTNFRIGCCGANIRIEDSILTESNFQEGGGSPVVGPLEIVNSHLINTPIDLPAANVSISNSIINYSSMLGVKFGNGTITNSSIIGNGDGVGIEITGLAGYNIGGSVTISNSMVNRNSIGIKLIGANVVTLQSNNIFGNATFNVENRTWKDITATSNYWGTADSSEIAATIFDYYDDINYGKVIYSPFLISPDTTAPISPPTGLSATQGTGSITLEWSANPESDVAGYKVYWGTQPAPFFENVVDVGDSTSYTITGDAYYIGVTAYDTDYAEANDDPDTIVNENQTNGYESWYANVVSDNQRPQTPTNQSPADGATDVALSPTLTADAFSDPDGDEHSNSQWQVDIATHDFSTPVFDSGADSTNLTSITVSGLSPNTYYKWRVRYQDSFGYWSEYSNPTVFSTTVPQTEGTLTIAFNKGLNMISLPNRPDTPYTAKSFAEKIGDVTLLIRYADKFESYLPGYDTDDGFSIEGGQGYIVNVTVSKPVAFTGTVWDDANPAPFEYNDSSRCVSGTTWAFVVVGVLPVELRDAGKLTVSVRNVNRNLCRECTLSHSEFRIAFVNADRRAVVEAGDRLEVKVTDANGRLVAEKQIKVEPRDITNALAIVNPCYNPIPEHTVLLQNYPNPFNPETWIPFQLAECAYVKISIYDISGKLIRTLVLGDRYAGIYTAKDRAAYWNGRNNVGERVSSGVYFYIINAGNFSAKKRMVILK